MHNIALTILLTGIMYALFLETKGNLINICLYCFVIQNIVLACVFFYLEIGKLFIDLKSYSLIMLSKSILLVCFDLFLNYKM